jgi:hypothetical protein
MTVRSGRALLLVIGIAACNSVFGIEEGRPRASDSDAAGAKTAGGEAGGAGDAGGRSTDGHDAGADTAGGHDAGGERSGCRHARWPAAPAGDAESVSPFLLAASSLDITHTESIGRDLDDSCTCPQAPSCNMPASAAHLCDGPDGRDTNGNGALAEIAGAFDPFSEKQLNQNLAQGRAGLVLRISGYNGLADDNRVSVEAFGKVWMKSAPLHQGRDEWLPYTDSVAASRAKDWDLNAYVTGHVLVARFPSFSLSLRPGVGENDNPVVLELEQAVLSGTLEASPSGFTLKGGNVAARWPTARFLGAFSSIVYPEEPVCGSSAIYSLLKTKVCGSADIMSDGALDGQGRDCDALSWAGGFETEPALLGEPETPQIVPVTGCPPDWQPSCF